MVFSVMRQASTITLHYAEAQCSQTHSIERPFTATASLLRQWAHCRGPAIFHGNSVPVSSRVCPRPKAGCTWSIIRGNWSVSETVAGLTTLHT
jgi:hypothetical protein